MAYSDRFTTIPRLFLANPAAFTANRGRFTTIPRRPPKIPERIVEILDGSTKRLK